MATGEGFFKFRHLDEVYIRSRMLLHFPDPATRPTLVLGHSHEVRKNAAYLGDGAAGPHPAFRHYVNSGAAGRFENLLWAVEIVDGEETVVSWSRPVPGSGKAERRTYTVQEPIGLGNYLAASASPSPLPWGPPFDPSIWLPSALHMMMRP